MFNYLIKFRNRLLNLATKSESNSLTTKLRKKRFLIFEKMIYRLCNPIKVKTKILDIGGTLDYWQQVYDINTNPLNLEITLLNLNKPTDLELMPKYFNYIIGNAKKMNNINNKEYDICFSNSLIEHIGDFSQQFIVINEIKRIAKYIYLQTPNLYFPIEPHYQLPLVQFLPLNLKMSLLSFFTKRTLKNEYLEYINDPINLLSFANLRALFEKEKFSIYRENFYGLTKSFVIYSKI